MVTAVANHRCETLARLIIRLSQDIQDLTRELALRQGRLLEQQGRPQQIHDYVLAFAEDIRTTEHQLEISAIDLVELERAFADWCRPGSPRGGEAISGQVEP